MYEEMVKLLRSHAKEHCPLDRASGICGSILASEVADAIENTSKAYQMMAEAYEAEVTKPRWIPVAEKLPEDSKNVLAAFDDVVLVAFYDNNEWTEAATYSLFFPTHWMPLPKPPKEET